MVDTIRTLSELNTLLADNTSNNITPQDIRDMMVSQMVHGEIGTLGQATETLGAGWQAVKLGTEGVFSRGVTLDAANYKITGVPCALKAVVTCEVVFRGVAGEDYEFTVYKDPDGTPAQLTALNRTFRVVNATQTVAHQWSAGISFAEDDEIQLAVRSANNDLKLDFGLLRLQRIGVE